MDMKGVHITQVSATWSGANHADVAIQGMTSSSWAVAMLNSASSGSITDVVPGTNTLRIRLTAVHTATHPVTVIWK